MKNKKTINWLVLLVFVFAAGCKSTSPINSAEPSAPTDTGATDTDNNASQPTPDTSSNTEPTTNSTFTPKSYIVGIDRCGGADCTVPAEKIPPKELWCVTGYRACPKK